MANMGFASSRPGWSVVGLALLLSGSASAVNTSSPLSTCADAKRLYKESQCCNAAGSTALGTSYAGDRFRSCVVFDSQIGRDDMSFNYMAGQGIDTVKAVLRAATAEYLPACPAAPASCTDARVAQLTQAVEDGCDGIMAIGFSMAEALKQVVGSHPDRKFAIVDAADVPEAQAFLFAENEGSFLVGAIAALKTKTGKVGFVGGVPIPLIQKFQAGFIAGVHAVNASVDVVSGYVANDFSGFWSPVQAKELTVEQINAGVDIVFHASGSSGLGVYNAVYEQSQASGTKKWAIGVDADAALSVSEELKPYILTSMLKRVDQAVVQASLAVGAGSWAPGVRMMDVANEGVGYSTSGGHVDDVKDEIEAFKLQIATGQLTVPSTV